MSDDMNLAQFIAERINGGKFGDARWYTEEQRELWRGHAAAIAECVLAWRPVDTAPKDGSKILAYDPSLLGICIARWNKNGWYVDEGSQDGMGYEGTPITLWMPMPHTPFAAQP